MKKINFFKVLIIGLFIYTLAILYLGISNINYLSSLLELKFWILSLLVPIIVFFLLSVRWFYFLRYLKYDVSYIEAAKIYLPGLSLIAAPARSGEAIRGIWLKTRFNIPIDVGISITLVERIGDLISALIIISFSILQNNIVIIASIILFILLIYLLLGTNYSKFSIRKYFPYPNYFTIRSRNNKIIILIKKLLKETSILCAPLPLLFSVVLSLLAWTIEGYLLYLLFSKLGVDITFKSSTLIRTAMGMGGVISFLPAGLFTTESTAIGLSLIYGSGRIEALAAAIFIRIYTLFVPFGFGFLSFYLQKDLRLNNK